MLPLHLQPTAWLRSGTNVNGNQDCKIATTSGDDDPVGVLAGSEVKAGALDNTVPDAGFSDLPALSIIRPGRQRPSKPFRCQSEIRW